MDARSLAIRAGPSALVGVSLPGARLARGGPIGSLAAYPPTGQTSRRGKIGARRVGCEKNCGRKESGAKRVRAKESAASRVGGRKGSGAQGVGAKREAAKRVDTGPRARGFEIPTLRCPDLSQFRSPWIDRWRNFDIHGSRGAKFRDSLVLRF